MPDMNLEALTKYDEVEVIVGFFDLMGYAKWCEGQSPQDILRHTTELFNRTGQSIAASGGVLIKAIGDAGLFVYPTDDPDKAVITLRELKSDSDSWLSASGYPDIMSVKVQVGPVAFGRVGPPGDERLDVYGTTVNRAAMMQGRAFTVGEALFNRLNSDTQLGLTRFNDDEFVAIR
ncbi:MAG: adenylate/guanylate cyclase domain-containing protein [Rhodospirillaceae bacterium]|jgi:class 3 adenylate cyclase|nr:adenylate/guanylate cyclase domain-containing protein [Rhodospirillales bacterium]MBT4702098.1 adenylate/guanylate cyclase domain-containing protein [Rhodospirillaceae bacterium]MBT6218904.1 adenylate/guanylate cyclase domain-containing protein [Rhodospirillaceae bacterium]MBT7769619.1 adenylate/guanylate cyclase domain-containing protein [Rhodospirillales bacterium]